MDYPASNLIFESSSTGTYYLDEMKNTRTREEQKQQRSSNSNSGTTDAEAAGRERAREGLKKDLLSSANLGSPH